MNDVKETSMVPEAKMNSKSAVEKAFKDMLVQFIEAGIGAWPEDPLLPLALVQVQKSNQDELLSGFEENFGSYVNQLSKRDVSVLLEASKHPLVDALNIESKYTEANKNTQETIWNYVTHLCRFASMNKIYKHIPKQVIGAVNEAASTLKEQIDNGSLDPKSINPFELGQQVMSKFSPTDIDQMMKQILGNPDAMSTMMTQMQSFLGDANSPIGAALGNALGGSNNPLSAILGQAGGSLDLSSLASLMNPNGGPMMPPPSKKK